WLEGGETLVEAVVHLGACSNTTERDASYLLENNYRFSQKLVQYAIKNNQRFVYTAPAATYGAGAAVFKDDHSTLDPLRPLNMYGLPKQLFGLWLKNEGLLDQ